MKETGLLVSRLSADTEGIPNELNILKIYQNWTQSESYPIQEAVDPFPLKLCRGLHRISSHTSIIPAVSVSWSTDDAQKVCPIVSTNVTMSAPEPLVCVRESLVILSRLCLSSAGIHFRPGLYICR